LWFWGVVVVGGEGEDGEGVCVGELVISNRWLGKGEGSRLYTLFLSGHAHTHMTCDLVHVQPHPPSHTIKTYTYTQRTAAPTLPHHPQNTSFYPPPNGPLVGSPVRPARESSPRCSPRPPAVSSSSSSSSAADLVKEGERVCVGDGVMCDFDIDNSQ
jgi:hypothetical protein